MAQKVTVAIEDDLDGGEADETVRFAIGGTGYEIDLSASNAAAFRRQLAPFITHARRADRDRAADPGEVRENWERSGDIQAWAKQAGITVSERRRVPPASLPSTKPLPNNPGTGRHSWA